MSMYKLQLDKPYNADLNDKNSRFPYNKDSIGIEFEALNDANTKPKTQVNVEYDALTEDQIKAGKMLVKFLKDYYKLSDADIYEHPEISYKTRSEANGTREAVK